MPGGGWGVLLSTAAGVTATVIGLLVGGIIGRRGQDRQWVRDQRFATCAKFLQAYSAIEIELREAYTAGRPAETADWAAFNAALVELSLVATPAVSAATREMVAGIGGMTLLVGRRRDGHDDYRDVHRQMSRAQLAFVDAARLSLDGSQQSLDWQMGGPPQWEEIERWLPTSQP